MGNAAAVNIVRVRIVRVRPLAAREPRTGLRLNRAHANYGLSQHQGGKSAPAGGPLERPGAKRHVLHLPEG